MARRPKKKKTADAPEVNPVVEEAAVEKVTDKLEKKPEPVTVFTPGAQCAAIARMMKADKETPGIASHVLKGRHSRMVREFKQAGEDSKQHRAEVQYLEGLL